MSSDLKRFLSRLLDTNPDTRITVDEITRDPWFRKGPYKEMRFYDEDFDGKIEKDESMTSLNAFDLISFSSGLDLSGLFDGSSCSVAAGERFVLGESPEKVVGKVEEVVGKEDGLRLKKRKEWGVDVKGQNGNLVVSVEVYRLTDSLVVLEVKREAGEGGRYNDMWEKKIKPELLGQPEGHVAEKDYRIGKKEEVKHGCNNA
ncbi:hypothetical protein RJ639_046759 [Escallonia herrerae]|uniref:non-specific serine/threonine protein kinase n=1 Tax=Escallonia herrerae TaxID=1293975 RepID=A0AA88W8D8_9ASTE|nr:hypothetical protein RJ639_046759 [Escallonia herrerae]